MDLVGPSLSEEITELVHQYEEPLLRYAAGLLRSPDLAQDIVQETFIRYLQHRGRRRGQIENLKAWLYRVAHNLALDWIRKNQRREVIHTEMAHNPKATHADGPDVGAARRDAEATAWALLEKLPEREQRIIGLKVVEGKSYKEIAEIMDLTTTNVGFILHKALKKMGRKLGKSLA